MRGFYGLMGAIWGAMLGFAITFVITGIFTRDDFGQVFVFIFFAPVGLFVGGCLGIFLGLLILRYLQRPTRGRTGWTPWKVLLIVSLYVGTPIVSILMVALTLSYTDTEPSDADMIVNFHRHQPAFKRLLVMVQTDKKLQRVDSRSTMPENPETIGVSPIRIAEYRRLFAIAGIKDGFDSLPGGGAEFNYWGIGSAISSDTSKDYVYLPKPPAALNASLDDPSPQHLGPDGKYDAFRRIEGNWYLKYEYLPD